MELTGEFSANIPQHIFDGVPEDTVVKIYFPGMGKPISGTLKNMEITLSEPLPQPAAWTVGFVENEQMVVANGGGWYAPAGLTFSMDFPVSPGFPPPPDQVDGGNVIATLKNAIPGLSDAKATCPKCVSASDTVVTLPPTVTDMTVQELMYGKPPSVVNVPVIDIVVHLNDHHKWSREQIADWLETQDWDLQFATPEGETA